VELASARVEEGVAPLLRDLLQRLQAVHGEPRAQHVDTPDTLPGETAQRGFRVRLQPTRPAQSALECHFVVLDSEPEPVREKPGGQQALAVVGVTQFEAARGDAVEAHHQLAGAAMRPPVSFDPERQGFDVARVVGVTIDEAKLRQAPHPLTPEGDSVEGAARGRRGVLRVQRQHQHPVHALGLELVKHMRQ
jgi:hypothetical protein